MPQALDRGKPTQHNFVLPGVFQRVVKSALV
jgi:hypothetical protein